MHLNSFVLSGFCVCQIGAEGFNVLDFEPVPKCDKGRAKVKNTASVTASEVHSQLTDLAAAIAALLLVACHLAFPFAVSMTTIRPVTLCLNAFLEPDGDGLPRMVKDISLIFSFSSLATYPPPLNSNTLPPPRASPRASSTLTAVGVPQIWMSYLPPDSFNPLITHRVIAKKVW